MLTTFDLDHYVYAALTAGASGFLLKDVTPEHLVAAVRWSAPATRCWRRPSPAGWSSGSPTATPTRR
jgi:DNA-binding NarL/FixJ family response regulator